MIEYIICIYLIGVILFSLVFPNTEVIWMGGILVSLFLIYRGYSDLFAQKEIKSQEKLERDKKYKKDLESQDSPKELVNK